MLFRAPTFKLPFNKQLFKLYVLELSQQKYYIGKTKKKYILDRYYEHLYGNGAEWTKLYKPIGILECFESDDKFIEDKYTKKYMDLYGIQNVRGGSYSNVRLEDYQIKCLRNEFATSNDLCFICGKYGHFASQCKKSDHKIS